MLACYNDGDFFKYFKENMNALGMPVPKGMFDTYSRATLTAGSILGALQTLGPGATAAELFGATVAAKKVLVLAAFGACAYAGAVVGSIAVASGRALSCGTRISDMFVFLHKHDLEFDGWRLFYQLNPEVLNQSHPHRKVFAAKARAQSFGSKVAA